MTHRVGGAVTIKDVAAIAGVSQATVSRVINSSAAVGEAKKRAVEEAIRRTGFQASVAAQRLATGKAESVAVILTEPVDELLTDPTYANVLRGILDRLTETEYTALLLMSSTAKEQQKASRLLAQGAADAMIHLSPYTGDVLLENISQQRIPLILCGRPTAVHGLGSYSLVYSDDVKSASLAGNYLVQQGCKQVLAMMGPPENPATTDRVSGYRDSLGSRLGEVHCVGDWSEETGYRKMTALLESVAVKSNGALVSQRVDSRTPWDAVVCGNDRIAVGVIRALAEVGLRVPDDVRVVGFDDHQIASTCDVPLTTVRQPFREQGRQSVDLAVEMIGGSDPRAVELDSELVIRESA